MSEAQSAFVWKGIQHAPKDGSHFIAASDNPPRFGYFKWKDGSFVNTNTGQSYPDDFFYNRFTMWRLT